MDVERSASGKSCGSHVNFLMHTAEYILEYILYDIRGQPKVIFVIGSKDHRETE